MSNFKRIRVERLQSEFRSTQCLSEVGEHETDLCVGARFGEEVFVLPEMGYLAVGIDLNPMMDNEFVLSGDEYSIEFSDGVFDKVFCYIFNHILDIEKALSEIARILRRPGALIVHIHRVEPQEFDVRSWDSPENFAAIIGSFLGCPPIIKCRSDFILAVFCLR